MDEDNGVEGAENREVEAQEEEEFEDSDDDDDDDDGDDDDDDESRGVPVEEKLSCAFKVLNGVYSDYGEDSLRVNMEPGFYDNTDFVQLLLGNVIVERVLIRFIDDNSTPTESLMLPAQDNVRKFLTALGSLPNLRQLILYGSKDQMTEMPVTMLSCCLSLATQRLEILACDNLHLTGTIEEVDNFGSHLRACKPLELLDFRECMFSATSTQANTGDNSNPIVTTILHAGGCLPKLRQLLLKPKAVGQLDQSAMNHLLGNPSFKDLHLENCMVDEVANALLNRANNPSLPKLERLRLTVNSCEAFSPSFANAMSAVVKANGIGNEMRLLLEDGMNALDEAGSLTSFLTAVARALRFDTSLRWFSINSPKRNRVGSSSKRLWKQFADLMEVNTNLIVFLVGDVLGDGGDDAGMINFFMTLNQLGRDEIMGSSWRGRAVADRKAWVEMLSRHSNSMDHLFYYLSANPALCELTSGTASKKRKHDML